MDAKKKLTIKDLPIKDQRENYEIGKFFERRFPGMLYNEETGEMDFTGNPEACALFDEAIKNKSPEYDRKRTI